MEDMQMRVCRKTWGLRREWKISTEVYKCTLIVFQNFLFAFVYFGEGCCAQGLTLGTKGTFRFWTEPGATTCKVYSSPLNHWPDPIFLSVIMGKQWCFIIYGCPRTARSVSTVDSASCSPPQRCPLCGKPGMGVWCCDKWSWISVESQGRGRTEGACVWSDPRVLSEWTGFHRCACIVILCFKKMKYGMLLLCNLGQ